METGSDAFAQTMPRLPFSLGRDAEAGKAKRSHSSGARSFWELSMPDSCDVNGPDPGRGSEVLPGSSEGQALEEGPVD